MLGSKGNIIALNFMHYDINEIQLHLCVLYATYMKNNWPFVWKYLITGTFVNKYFSLYKSVAAMLVYPAYFDITNST